MKNWLQVVVVFLSTVLGVGVAHAQLLAQFDHDNYTGWVYTRSGITLNTDNVLANKINLYGNYMLQSPAFDVSKVKYVEVEVTINCQKYYLGENYDLAKASPTIELIDASGNVLAQKQHLYAEPLLYQQFAEKIAVPEGVPAQVRLQLAAHSGDVNCTGAVRAITVLASNDSGVLVGDLDGNGVVNIADVTLLIDIVLNHAVTSGAADVNGDGEVNVSDVTQLINIILQ